VKNQQTVEEIRRKIRCWYNGYRFSGEPNSQSVYNPLSLMSYFKSHRLANYWFATGTPTFAYQLIREQNYELPDFESDIVIGNSIEMNHEPDSLDLMTLLYQTGYLTIKKYKERTQRYTLQFPNEEVQRSFFEHLFHHFSELKEFQISKFLTSLEKNVLENDFPTFFESVNALLSSIPYSLHVANEAYYHSLIYLLMKLLGFNVSAEVMTSTGRVDLIVKQPRSVAIFEFKFNRSAKEAIQQIKDQNYYSQYLHSGRKLYLIGANFDQFTRTVNEWECEIV
jgi:Holliday junction resolvase-like predicted endonuclease